MDSFTDAHSQAMYTSNFNAWMKVQYQEQFVKFAQSVGCNAKYLTFSNLLHLRYLSWPHKIKFLVYILSWPADGQPGNRICDDRSKIRQNSQLFFSLVQQQQESSSLHKKYDNANRISRLVYLIVLEEIIMVKEGKEKTADRYFYTKIPRWIIHAFIIFVDSIARLFMVIV